MLKFRFLLTIVGTLLIGRGLIITTFATTSIISDVQNGLSPFDQVDDVSQPDKGFVPMVVPTLEPTRTMTRDDAAQSAFRAPTGQPSITPRPISTATPAPAWIPNRIVVPAIELDAPVVAAKLRTISYQETVYPQWVAPNSFAAGWDTHSASLGIPGNTVLFGHHNVHGEVFRYLANLEVGDLIVMYSGKSRFTYTIALKMIMQERNEPLEVRMRNAEWILPSRDERLTLITCWPYTSNTHRLIIVAIPVKVDDLMSYPVIPRLP